MENKHTNSENTHNYNEKYDHNLIEGHDYDGIMELDNPPPPWLMILFYITIVFSAGYAAYYHWFGQGPLQEEEYRLEMAAAEEKYKNVEKVDLDNIELSTDAELMKQAAKDFASRCVTCHGKKGEGNAIGPNLTDEYWITGNSPKTVYQTIKNGTPNGMTAFSSLSDDKIMGLTSFILNKLQGSNPEGAKEPEGKKM